VIGAGVEVFGGVVEVLERALEAAVSAVRGAASAVETPGRTVEAISRAKAAAAYAVRGAAAVRVDPFLKSVGGVFKKIGVSKLGGMTDVQTDTDFSGSFF
jgi:hypothetical protein